MEEINGVAPPAPPVEPVLIPAPPTPGPKRRIRLIATLLATLACVSFAAYTYFSQAQSTPAAKSSAQVSTTHICNVSATLINSCRAWFGAAASGNPGASKDGVDQFNYLESLVGRPLDIYRSYHSYPGSSSGIKDQPLNTTEITLAARSGTYLDINWNPASTWAQAAPVSEGGNPSVNANVDSVAKSIKSLAPHKVFLSLWHETNLSVDKPDADSRQCIPSNNRAYGSPSQFNTAWRNVYQHFQNAGATNVVWVINYASYAPRNCWVKYLWPGNQYVDWVIYDTYSRGKTWDDTSGSFYHLLEQDSSATVDIASKPWGIGEFGTCKQSSGISESAYYQSVKRAVDANAYPRLKMYLVYADTGNKSGMGCLTNYDSNGQKDSAKQAVFNQLANDPAFTSK